MLADLHEMIANDYRKNGRRTLGRIEECWEHIKGFFGESERAISIDEARIDAHAVHRAMMRDAAAMPRRTPPRGPRWCR